MVGQVLLLLMLLLGLLPMARRQRCRVAAAGEQGSPRRAVGCACCCQHAAERSQNFRTEVLAASFMIRRSESISLWIMISLWL